MHASAKKYLSILFLCLFAFPYVQKGVHDLEHASELHCTDKSSDHFHENSHACSLCDYTIGKAAVLIKLIELDVEEVSSPFLFSEIEFSPFGQTKYLFLLRGPPVLS